MNDPHSYKSPFEHLPGNPPNHQVMGETSDGFKIRADAVEMVWNDRHFINFVRGPGSYEAAAGPRELEVLALAKTLYGLEQ